VRVTAGIGGPADAAALPASREEADESLALHAPRPGTPLIVYDESWDQILLHRLRVVTKSGRTPARAPVVNLRRHDADFRTNYVQTLQTWLEHNRDTTSAAASLAMHPNTIRYRLRKISHLTGLDLESPGQRLATLIALAATSPDPIGHAPTRGVLPNTREVGLSD
jgi:sugar diacid utilization regulator